MNKQDKKRPIGKSNQDIHYRNHSKGPPEPVVDPLFEDPDKRYNSQGNIEQQKEDLTDGQKIQYLRMDKKAENKQESPKKEDRTEDKQGLSIGFFLQNTTSFNM